MRHFLAFAFVLVQLTVFPALAEDNNQSNNQLAVAPAAGTTQTRVEQPRRSKLRLGVMGGLAVTEGRIHNTRTTSTGTDDALGFAGGVGLEIEMHRNFAIGPELMFVQKGGSLSGVEIGLNYLEIPFLAKGKFGNDNVKFNLFGGPFVSIALSKSIDDASQAAILDSLRDFDLGFHGGMGLEIAVASNAAIFMNARYMLGIMDLFDQTISVEMSSGGFLFLSGVRLGL